ncbi:hypothetical protein D3273_16025 [Lichenibacterium minor]|uniref:Uncharacterized protein n=1 Tax=Lichenibacterium minor TaxID=2316528 RepID=A0A4Q2U5F8_9HYPH|nr:hypothetical protein [Lichenibacterium minor]RYC31038.1 hypothetical protein D3273_16025 [Lichenibacterium minor]
MPFETLTERLQAVATTSLNHFVARYGSHGLKIENGIADSISWRPSFYLRPAKYHIVAVEVEDNLYPISLKGSAHEISIYELPISVYQACSLEAYLADTRQREINALKQHGFGIVTVDENSHLTVQHSCIPMAQFISKEQFDSRISSVGSTLKPSLKSAYETYSVRTNQGLQEAAQVVEGVITSVVYQAVKKGILTNSQASKPLADQIDALYATNNFKPYRAALGGARDFVKQYRNSTSHSPASAKQASERARMARNGFLDSILICENLYKMSKAMKYKIHIHNT